MQVIKVATKNNESVEDTNPFPVKTTSTALPTGAATSAKQDDIKALIGEVQANPTANSLLARLKDISGYLSGILTAKIDQTTDGTTNRVVAKISQAAGENHVELLDSAGAALDKAEDAAHSSGDKGIMALGVRSDTAAATAANGDYHPFIFDANGALWVQLAGVLSAALDSIDVSKMSKGGAKSGSDTGINSAAASVAAGTELNITGFNSVMCHITIAGAAKNWTIKLQGCFTSGGSFVDWYDGATQMSQQTNASRCIVWKGLPDYIKFVATEDEDGATCTVACQPLNVM